MRLLTDDGVGAADGLALDEAMMAGYAREAPDRPATLRLYTYASHCALCGRYQHLDAEIDLDACREAGVTFNRRPTGGGAIIMGEGQLGVAVIGRATTERPKDTIVRLSRGIVTGLATGGIDAAFGGKNDLKVGRRKIAGLGLYLDGRGGMLFHASVLADLDIGFMLGVLRIPASKLGSEGVDAVAQRVTTVSRETGSRWTGFTLRDVIARGFAQELGVTVEHGAPDDAEVTRMRRLVRDKYDTADWLHQRRPQPDATATSLLKTPGGLVRLYLALQGDTVKSALFTGDFNHIPEPLSRFENGLRWSRLDPERLARLADDTMGGDTGLGVPPAALVDAVLAAAARAAERELAAPHRTGSCYFPEGGSK